MRVARLIGVEGRVDKDNFAIPERVPILKLAATRKWDLNPGPGDALMGPDIIEYVFDFEADDGTLIYRRTTELWR